MEGLKGRVWREALGIAVPLMLAESVDSVLWIVDAYFVGRLGEKALAAVSLGGYLSWMMFVLGFMFYVGVFVLVSQAVGAGRRGLAVRVAGEALSANLLLSVPISLAAYAASPLLVGTLAGSGASAEVRELAVEYFRARLAGLPPAYAGLVLGAAYRGFGLTRPVLASTAAAAVVNAVLDPVLIFGCLGAPALGLAGAGYASAIASAVDAAILLALAPRYLGVAVKPALWGRWAAKAASVGAPYLAERVATVAAHLIYVGVIARCGDVALAAHTIGVRIESLAFLPLFSMAEASGSLVGQRLGAGDVEGGEKTGWLVSQLSLATSLGVAAVLAAISGLAPKAFTDDPRVAGLARLYLLIAAATEPPYAVSEALLMSIRGAGNTLIPTLASTGSIYALRIPVAVVLSRKLGPSHCAVGAWLGMAADMAGRLALALFLYRRLFRKLARLYFTPEPSPLAAEYGHTVE
ncbi:MATE family efflux transporter [Stetteria hydrogenophila]